MFRGMSWNRLDVSSLGLRRTCAGGGAGVRIAGSPRFRLSFGGEGGASPERFTSRTKASIAGMPRTAELFATRRPSTRAD